MVAEAGLEPARSYLRGILSPLCLPIPPLGLSEVHNIYFFLKRNPKNNLICCNLFNCLFKLSMSRLKYG